MVSFGWYGCSVGWNGRTEFLPEKDADLLFQLVGEGFRDAVGSWKGAFPSHCGTVRGCSSLDGGEKLSALALAYRSEIRVSGLRHLCIAYWWMEK